MKELLIDVVRQTAPLFEKVRVTGLPSGLRVEGHSEDKMLFLLAELTARRRVLHRSVKKCVVAKRYPPFGQKTRIV